MGCLRAIGLFWLWSMGSSLIAGLIAQVLEWAGIVDSWYDTATVIVLPVAIGLGILILVIIDERKAKREEVEDYSGADRKKTTDTKERDSAYLREKYDAYLLSREWKEKADICKLNAGYRCQLCNGEDRLVAHHKTYDRIFRELDTDLICLCTRCHEKHHTNDYSNMFEQ